MSLELTLLVAHAPSMCHEDQVPDFQQDLVNGLKKMRDRMDQIKPDAIVIMSCHFPATFHHYVDATPRHKGVLTSLELPDLISNVPYDYPGDEELAAELVEAGQREGIPVVKFNDPAYVWDYGTLVPLRYMVPRADIPIVDLSVCLASPLDETYRWGEVIGKTLRDSSKKTVFVSSGALSHNLVRGRQNMPTVSEMAMNDKFMVFLEKGQYTEAWNMLTQYARIAGVESGGRHLAALLGVLDPNQKAEFWGVGQSSGSWNAIISFAS